MKHLFWKMSIMAAMVMSLFVALPVSADDETLEKDSGVIEEVYRELSIIEIRTTTGYLLRIQGFPFNNLEAQLEEELNEEGITIEQGDCLTVKYSEHEMGSGDIVNKLEFLTMFSKGGCDTCELDENYHLVCDCDIVFCDDDGMEREPLKSMPKPGYGWGDNNHQHEGPPCQEGNLRRY